MRSKVDIDWAVKYFNAKKVLLIRKPDEATIYGNEADDNILTSNYDYIIENTGNLDDLYDAAETFIEDVFITEEFEEF